MVSNSPTVIIKSCGVSPFCADILIQDISVITNSSEKPVIAYEKCGNAENHIKEVKYDMSFGHLLLQSFRADDRKRSQVVQGPFCRTGYALVTRWCGTLIADSRCDSR